MRAPRFMSIMHQSNEKSRNHVCRADPGDRGVSPTTPLTVGDWNQVECNLGSSFIVSIKKIGSNRSRHSEFFLELVSSAEIMAELTDEEMNQQMDQHEAVSI